MDSSRLTILPDPALAEFGAEMGRKIAAAADATGPAELPALLDSLMRGCIDMVLGKVRADEGSVWLLDEERKSLVVAYNNVSAEFVGFVQPLESGLISMVVATEQPICENRARRHPRFSAEADNRVGKLTHAMIAAPLYYGDAIRGVVSCVQHKKSESDPDPPGFTPGDLAEVELLAELLGRLIDARLAGKLLGMASR